MAGPLTFCERAAEECPQHAALFERLSELYNRKLWHQLLLHVEKAIKEGVFSDDLLVRLYHDFIAHFGFKINLLAFAKLAVEASKAYTEPAQGLSFLEVEMAKMQGPECSHLDVREPVLYMKMHLSQFKLNLGDVQESKKLFEEGLEELDRMRDVDPVVSASVHWVRSLYHKYMKDFAEFYRSALMYLCFVSSDELSEDFKKPLAVDISLAALLGEGVYNFGELLLHPIVNSIKDSSYQWLYELLECFHAGDMHLYDELCARHTAALNAQPALVENARRLREKITILSLMELITSTPAEERKIALADIGTRTKLDTDGVEFLLMKTMSLGLIKGVIDEVDSFVQLGRGCLATMQAEAAQADLQKLQQSVPLLDESMTPALMRLKQVSWVQPRVMTVPQISALGERLQGWIDKVDRAAQLLEDRGVTLEAA